MRFRKAGPQAQRRLKLARRTGQVLVPLQQIAQVIMGPLMAWVQAHRLPVLPDRLIDASFGTELQGQFEMRLRVVRPLLRHHLDLSPRLTGIDRHQHGGQIVACLCQRRPPGERLLVFSDKIRPHLLRRGVEVTRAQDILQVQALPCVRVRGRRGTAGDLQELSMRTHYSPETLLEKLRPAIRSAPDEN